MSEAPKVVSLRGGEITPPAEPCKPVIDVLEELLERARGGQLRAVVVGFVAPGGRVDWTFAQEGGASWALLAAARYANLGLEHRLFIGDD